MRISPLRQRMIGDMTARHFSEKAQKDYIRCVNNLAAFIGRPPETATAEDLRLYRLHLVQSPLGAFTASSSRRRPRPCSPSPPIKSISAPESGITAVLHTWGSALTHHPHVHMIVPGGGLSPDGERFIRCRRGFFLPVRVLSRLFRRLFLEKLGAGYDQGRLILRGRLPKLAIGNAFTAVLKPLWRKNWFVYAKRPFAGSKAVLAYLSRYTHRVAISNTRLIAHDERGVTFRYKDYRVDGLAERKVMTLSTDEFIRRFLLHTVPKGLHRIRHYGLFASTGRAANLVRLRELLGVTPAEE